MLISRQHNFAFYHLNKCGGTSIVAMLNMLGVDFEQIGKKHIPISRKNYDTSGLNLYANIRNPFHRIVSMYEYRKQFSQRNRFKDTSFREFFYDWYLAKDNDEFKPIHEFLFIKSRQEYPTCLRRGVFTNGELPDNLTPVKLEECDLMWPEIIDFHFGRKVTVPVTNTTKHSDPMGYFTGSMIAEVTRKEWWAVEEYGL